MTLSRRDAVRLFWGWLLGSPAVAAEESYEETRRAPPAEILNADEMEEAARLRLSPAVFEHIRAGAGSERTLRRNREFFERIVFRPRVLRDVSRVDLSTQLLGANHFAPILVGPTARHRRLHPRGETATAAGAAAARTAMVVSERASEPFAELGGEGRVLWTQLSPETRNLAEMARARESEGAQAIVFTVGMRPRPRPDVDVRLGLAAASDVVAQRRDGGKAFEQLRAASELPIVVKGVLDPAEAIAAVEAGADAVCVSNHGGRVVDGSPATIEALPAVAAALNGRAPVLVDGGFRRGSDILKALALGADAVMLGRPALWALAAYGETGVARLLEILQYELALAMGLSGTASLADIRRELVRIHRW